MADIAVWERKLREHVAAAVNAGQYAEVREIMGWAETMAGFGKGSPSPEAVAVPSSRPGTPLTTTPARRGKGSQYPRFFRRGDELVKVGWSKKERKEYSHRASRRVVDAVAAAVVQLGASGRLFTGDKVLKLKDPADGEQIADYQAYVALAWFRHLGLVDQRGRKAGYAVVADKSIAATVNAAWRELAEWRG